MISSRLFSGKCQQLARASAAASDDPRVGAGIFGDWVNLASRLPEAMTALAK